MVNIIMGETNEIISVKTNNAKEIVRAKMNNGKEMVIMQYEQCEGDSWGKSKQRETDDRCEKMKDRYGRLKLTKEGHDENILNRDFVLRKIRRSICHARIEFQSVRLIAIDYDAKYIVILCL